MRFKYSKWGILTWVSRVYSVDSLIQQRAVSLLKPAGHCYWGPAHSDWRTGNEALRPELHSLSPTGYRNWAWRRFSNDSSPLFRLVSFKLIPDIIETNRIKKWSQQTWEFPVYSVDSSVQQREEPVLHSAGCFYSGPALSDCNIVPHFDSMPPLGILV